MPLGMVLALAFFTLILGYVIGNFLPMLKNNPLSPKSGSSSSPAEKQQQEIGQPPAEILPLEPAASPPGLLEIARMFRREGTNQLVAQIDNNLISGKDALNSDQHALLSLLLLDLTDWVGIQTRLDAAAGSTGSASPDEGESTAEHSGFSPVDMFKKALQADVFLPSAEISLAAQINPFLQELLQSSPLEDKGIRLMDIKGRGITVVIGLEMFDSVEDVPDPEVRALIKQAVSNWETSQEGNE